MVVTKINNRKPLHYVGGKVVFVKAEVKEVEKILVFKYDFKKVKLFLRNYIPFNERGI
jgi:hypothetical protein